MKRGHQNLRQPKVKKTQIHFFYAVILTEKMLLVPTLNVFGFFIKS